MAASPAPCGSPSYSVTPSTGACNLIQGSQVCLPLLALPFSPGVLLGKCLGCLSKKTPQTKLSHVLVLLPQP
ncbi:hypothetical protein CapIbe_010087 [Capra ibex]